MALLRRLPAMKPDERDRALAELQRLYATGEVNRLLPAASVDLVRYSELSPADQARLEARSFFEDLVLGDPAALLSHCGLPFMLEDRKVERVEELRAEWSRSLTTNRTDLLRLHDVEILTVAEMEKRHGPVPRRLQGWPLRGPATFVAVGNLSGRPAVVLLKQAGAAWQVVAYSD